MEEVSRGGEEMTLSEILIVRQKILDFMKQENVKKITICYSTGPTSKEIFVWVRSIEKGIGKKFAKYINVPFGKSSDNNSFYLHPDFYPLIGEYLS